MSLLVALVLGVSAGAALASGSLGEFGQAAPADPAELPLWLAGLGILILRQRVLPGEIRKRFP
ncbi:MAG: hypothetical protein ACXU8N_00040 [Telluria sp.]